MSGVGKLDRFRWLSGRKPYFEIAEDRSDEMR